MVIHRNLVCENQNRSPLTQWFLPGILLVVLITLIACPCCIFSNAMSTSPPPPSVKKNVTVGLIVIMEHNVDPLGLHLLINCLHMLCSTIFNTNINALLLAYPFGYNTQMGYMHKSSRIVSYIYGLVGKIGIPIFSLDLFTNTFDKVTDEAASKYLFRMYPTLAHQISAMISIIQQYKWTRFSIVTSNADGHHDFISEVKNQIVQKAINPSLTLLTTVELDPRSNDKTMRKHLMDLYKTDTNIFLLYAELKEAQRIFEISADLGFIGSNYVWIWAHLTISDCIFNSNECVFPLGTIGIDIHADDPDRDFAHNFVFQIRRSLSLFTNSLRLFLKISKNNDTSLLPKTSCYADEETSRVEGVHFMSCLRNASFDDHDDVAFNVDGTQKHVSLSIYNLQERYGLVKCGSWTPFEFEVDVKTWPGNTADVPSDIPKVLYQDVILQNQRLKVTFLEEPPFIISKRPGKQSDKCDKQEVVCFTSTKMTQPDSFNTSRHEFWCCSGFIIDLLTILSKHGNFTYDLARVEDGSWGGHVNSKWNGLVATLLNKKADIVMTSFSVNSMRASVVDFSVPFLDTGIAIVVAKKTGIISTTAFLEPFDSLSWIAILLVGVHVVSFVVFALERRSSSMRLMGDKKHKVSLLSSYWLIWADLLNAAVSVKWPRSISARVVTGAWAMFALMFGAIYTANLASYMITQEDYIDLSGIEDKRLAEPYSHNPPLRFGTVPNTHTDTVLQQNHPNMHQYMQQFNKTNVMEGIMTVRNGELDAFIYDAVILNYLLSQDDTNTLLIVGSRYPKTGYAIGFPRFSEYLPKFNQLLMLYSEEGIMDRFWKSWFTDEYRADQRRTSNEPVTLAQFTSVFILLGLGLLLSIAFLVIEIVYFKCFRGPQNEGSLWTNAKGIM